MADVVTMVADGNCHLYMGWCFCPIYNIWNSQLWQLMNSCGRCYGHLCDWLMLLLWWQMKLATVGMCQCIKADVKTLLADVMAMGLYFIFSSVVLTRTSSHTWGRWYLPMFLFRDGLLTLMYIDSFINLERLCSSLPTILKLLSVVEWPVMLLWSYIG